MDKRPVQEGQNICILRLQRMVARSVIVITKVQSHAMEFRVGIKNKAVFGHICLDLE